MTVDWSHFTPWTAAAGGMLIGLAAAALLLLNGRIAGISGIVGGLLRGPDRAWRAAFIAGLLLAPLVWRMVAELPAATVSASPALLVAAGLLVGFGSRLGSGCTSGHGVCGISRLSPRSLIATAAFMAAGFLVVYLLKHVWGLA
ncbi:MAG: YeeE/YedE family protein [Rhodocyclaceae bacterium]|nr:YeeE/YedE family protein [Rhodocyclaceae bacterium]